MTKAADKIIVALDVPTRDRALALVKELAGTISFYKVGLQLYTADGPAIVRELLAQGAKVFLDLKLNDIPNTVAGAVKSAAALGVQMLTIHLGGGAEMIRAAVAASTEKMSILGVTVLTSANAETLRETGINDQVPNQVLRLAKLGAANGVRAIVASPQEISGLRSELGDQIKIVTPGVRPGWSEAGDQKRTMTPRDAIAAGANYLVIGRPITAHPSPREAITKILAELE